MRAIAGVAFLSLLACGDSTGPEVHWLHDGYVIERVETRGIPARLKYQGPGAHLWVVEGGVRCPASEDGLPAQEVYTFRIEDPLVGTPATVPFDVVCEVEPPDRIRFTYLATGENTVGRVWEGEGAEEGQVFQTKQFPSRETFLAVVEALGWHVETWSYRVYQDPAPEATFSRFR